VTIPELTKFFEDARARRMPWIMLVLPQRKSGCGDRVRLCGSRGPVGHVMRADEKEILAMFETHKGLKYLRSLKVD
jgi:hypothetical protein